ncbi:MAG: hypothetical protein RRB13_14325 [bacterium]|nr:hypothetical protein [bacterium]
MKLISRILSILFFFASFGAALYLGYRLFKGKEDDSGYLFGDSLYREGDQVDLYQSAEEEGIEEESTEEQAEAQGPPLERAEGLSSMIH